MASDHDRKVRVKSVGMFDNNLGTPFADTFQDGETFTLQAARIGPEISTEYGPARVVLLKIDGELYSLFGKSLEIQIANMESGDLPAEVRLIRVKSKKGNKGMKVLWPADKALPDDTFPYEDDNSHNRHRSKATGHVDPAHPGNQPDDDIPF
jgi:hypothetical protein